MYDHPTKNVHAVSNELLHVKMSVKVVQKDEKGILLYRFHVTSTVTKSTMLEGPFLNSISCQFDTNMAAQWS